jgi:carboxyl-terminal processing protease
MIDVIAVLTLTPFTAYFDDYCELYDRCSNAIRTRYYGRVTRKDEMEKILNTHEKKAKAATSHEQFRDAMNSLTKDFGDSHFDFFTTDDQGFYMMDGFMGEHASEMPHIGAWFKPSTEGYTVTMVLDGMAAQNAGLRKGDIIMKIEETPFSPVRSLENYVDKEATIEFKRNGAILKAKVIVKKQKAFDMFLEATRNSAKVIEHENKKIAYLHLWTMVNDNFRNALHSLIYGKFRDTDAFILDIRDGFGGRPEGFGDPFFRPEIKLEWKISPGMTNYQLFGYQKPLILLINEGSRSAKEIFSYIMKKSGRAILIGATTAGHVLGTSPYKVADWAHLEIPMVDVTADGYRIEGKGVSPNISVDLELDSDGNDLHIKKALETIKEKLTAKEATLLRAS